MKDFNAELQKAEAIREVRARGCTVAGVAELIVEYHGALHVLSNLDQTQALGEQVARDADSQLGRVMRAILADAAAKEVKAEPTPVVDLTERAVKHVMNAGYSEEAARQIVAEHGAETVLAGEEESSKPAEATVAGSVRDAATGAGASGAAGSSPASDTATVAPVDETATEAVDPTPAA